jgi:5-methylcytosine-specific restriction endonuclease McrA
MNNLHRAADHHEIMAELETMKTLGKQKPTKQAKTPKRRKTTERKKLIKQLDQVVREIVFQDDPHYCVTCGKTSNLQLGHLITRSRYGTRWDLMNCHIQCSGCNYRHEFQPEIYTRYFLNRYGEQEYNNLCHRAETQGKFTIDELETKLMELTEQIDE